MESHNDTSDKEVILCLDINFILIIVELICLINTSYIYRLILFFMYEFEQFNEKVIILPFFIIHHIQVNYPIHIYLVSVI